jgi:hypothetical protein
MIHHTCPCCQCHYPPHRVGCTFSQDCPEEFDDFNCVAMLRQECDRLRAEVASVTLTDEERLLISWAKSDWTQHALHWRGNDENVADESDRNAATLDALLARTAKEETR